jgi:hypothetical protein
MNVLSTISPRLTFGTIFLIENVDDPRKYQNRQVAVIVSVPFRGNEEKRILIYPRVCGNQGGLAKNKGGPYI